MNQHMNQQKYETCEINDTFHFDPEVWGPHYWFFIHTIALTYPKTPNAITKRKYYDFIMNLPLFIPNPALGDSFARYLDQYPVTPYLDNRQSFIRWVFFLHNRINKALGKNPISFYEALDTYYNLYKPKPSYQISRTAVFFAILVFITVVIIFFYIFELWK